MRCVRSSDCQWTPRLLKSLLSAHAAKVVPVQTRCICLLEAIRSKRTNLDRRHFSADFAHTICEQAVGIIVSMQGVRYLLSWLVENQYILSKWRWTNWTATFPKKTLFCVTSCCNQCHGMHVGRPCPSQPFSRSIQLEEQTLHASQQLH